MKRRLAHIIDVALIASAALLVPACPGPEGDKKDPQPDKKTLTVVVQKAGDGLGSVVSDPEGLDCGTDCTEQERAFVIGGHVALAATPARDALFGGWTCVVENGSTIAEPGDSIVASTPDDVEGERIVCTATFRQLYTLLVLFSGEGVGAVTGTLLKGDGVTPRIDCSSDGSGDCIAGYFADEVDTLSAQAENGSVFSSWALDCGTGTAPATVTMDEDKDCEATFD